MISELKKLRELTETLTGNGYLKDQAEEWEYALDAIPDCIYIINDKFEIKFINKALATKLNIEKHEVYGKVCTSTEIGCMVTDPVCENCRSVIDSPNVVDVFLTSLQGWYNITRSPIYTVTKKLIGFICVFQDITTQKEACTDATIGEKKFNAMMELSPNPSFVFNLDTTIVNYVNSAFENFFHIDKDHILGKSFNALDLWANDKDDKRFYTFLNENGSINNLTFLLKVRENGVRNCLINASVVEAEQVVCVIEKPAWF